MQIPDRPMPSLDSVITETSRTTISTIAYAPISRMPINQFWVPTLMPASEQQSTQTNFIPNTVQIPTSLLSGNVPPFTLLQMGMNPYVQAQPTPNSHQMYSTPMRQPSLASPFTNVTNNSQPTFNSPPQSGTSSSYHNMPFYNVHA